MLTISLQFPTKRFHATPWGRQVNEGAVEWPPSPWRMLRSLIATWYHKFPQIPEVEFRELIEQLADPPRFCLPGASQGHTRHYMPLVNDDRTKVFDTFVLVDPEEAVLAIWPDVSLSPSQLDLLDQILRAMTYFGRAESWVCAQIVESSAPFTDVQPLELGQSPPEGFELVRTLVPASVADHHDWFTKTREQHRQRKLATLVSTAKAKGKPTDAIKLTKKDEQAIDDSLPSTLFAALQADTSELRKAGWNQPPGTQWINYCRPINCFTGNRSKRKQVHELSNFPTVARFAVCGTVRPLLTETIIIGEQVRHVLMGCSKKVRKDNNSSQVFSGKNKEGLPLSAGHQHAHFLCESADGSGRISHVNVFAPMGFDSEDEIAFARLARNGVWGRDGYDLQLVRLGVGQPQDFGGLKERSGESRILATSSTWISRTPFVPTRHLSRKSIPGREVIASDPKLQAALIDTVRFELSQRPQFKALAQNAIIEPILELKQFGTFLGGHFTSWLKFRRERKSGGGSHAGSHGFGFRLTFCDSNRQPILVSGPITLGYGCHYGLGQFEAESQAELAQ